jgi:hypothetical protein
MKHTFAPDPHKFGDGLWEQQLWNGITKIRLVSPEYSEESGCSSCHGMSWLWSDQDLVTSAPEWRNRTFTAIRSTARYRQAVFDTGGPFSSESYGNEPWTKHHCYTSSVIEGFVLFAHDNTAPKRRSESAGKKENEEKWVGKRIRGL